MRTKSPRARAKPAIPNVIIPPAAHLCLIQMRDHLRLLASLTDHGTVASDLAHSVRPDAMAWCFSSLARDLDAIIVASRPQLN